MVFLFYISGIIAVLSTVGVILSYHPIRAVLYLVVSFLAISCVFFSLGAFLVGALEVIVYAGAVMILFVFALMMLNDQDILYDFQKYKFPPIILYVGAIFLTTILLLILLYVIFESENSCMDISSLIVDNKQLSYKIFDSYVLAVEMVSFILLGALISVLYVSQEHR